MAVDIGTGSGAAVLRRAAREPETLFVAVDADASSMNDASRRAARPTRRGGLDNVIFVAAAAEALPDELDNVADEVTVVLPWGSLLAAVLEPESATFAGIAALLRPNGEMLILVSAQERDRVAGEVTLDANAVHDLARRYTSAGLRLAELRAANRSDVRLLSSGWGQRLGIPDRRTAWLFRLRRSAGADHETTAQPSAT